MSQDQPLNLGILHIQVVQGTDSLPRLAPQLVGQDKTKETKILDLREVLHPDFQRSMPCRIRIWKV